MRAGEEGEEREKEGTSEEHGYCLFVCLFVCLGMRFRMMVYLSFLFIRRDGDDVMNERKKKKKKMGGMKTGEERNAEGER